MEVLLPEERIHERIREMAKQITSDYQGKPLTIVGVLSGCVMFMADLVRYLNLPLRIAFIQASSYRGEVTRPGELKIQPDLLPDLRGRDVLLLDDILDTGQTLASLIEYLKTMGTTSVRSVVLLRKLGRQTVDVQADYSGFDIPDVFVVGFGLDYNDLHRNLPYIAALSSEDIE